MLDYETWRFINSFAPWLSALGTLTAVVVSLWLARRTERPRVRVRTAIAHVVAERSPGSVLQITATNLGGRPVTLQNLTWRTGVFRKREYVQFPPDNIWSPRLPAKLDHGEYAMFILPLDGLPAEHDPIAKALSTASFPRLAVRSVRAGVVLTTGHIFRPRVERSVQRWILDQVRKRGATSAE
jgi:hypothetical protein